MTEQQFNELKKSKLQASINLENANLTFNQIERTFRLFACKECGGSGSVDVSREPCSTAMRNCPECNGKGFKS